MLFEGRGKVRPCGDEVLFKRLKSTQKIAGVLTKAGAFNVSTPDPVYRGCGRWEGFSMGGKI